MSVGRQYLGLHWVSWFPFSLSWGFCSSLSIWIDWLTSVFSHLPQTLTWIHVVEPISTTGPGLWPTVAPPRPWRTRLWILFDKVYLTHAVSDTTQANVVAVWWQKCRLMSGGNGSVRMWVAADEQLHGRCVATLWPFRSCQWGQKWASTTCYL